MIRRTLFSLPRHDYTVLHCAVFIVAKEIVEESFSSVGGSICDNTVGHFERMGISSSMMMLSGRCSRVVIACRSDRRRRAVDVVGGRLDFRIETVDSFSSRTSFSCSDSTCLSPFSFCNVEIVIHHAVHSA